MTRPKARQVTIDRDTPPPLAPSPDNGIPYGTPATAPSSASTSTSPAPDVDAAPPAQPATPSRRRTAPARPTPAPAGGRSGKQLNTRIPDDLHDRLTALSEETGIVIRRLVISALERELDRYDKPS